MSKTVVTGGAGFIGSHLVDALIERGERVTLIDNLRRGRVEFIQRHLDRGELSFFECDIRDRAALAPFLDGAGVVYHLAAQSNVLGAMQDGEYSFSTNVIGTYNVLAAAVEARVERVVFTSSREIYGDPVRIPAVESDPPAPKNPYGASKAAGEAYAAAFAASYGLDVAILRLANAYGPRDRDRVIPRWLEFAQRGQDLPVYGGQQVLDFVPIRTVVQALLHAGDHGLEGPVNVGTGKGTSILDLAQRIVAETSSGSRVDMQPANQCEVVQFIADVSRMRGLGVEPPEDPLVDLRSMIRA